MNSDKVTTFVIIPETDLLYLGQLMEDIHQSLNDDGRYSAANSTAIPDYIPAAAFMKAVQ